MNLRKTIGSLFSFVVAALLAVNAAASPCSGIGTPFPANLWPQWERAIARQLDVRQVKPLAYLAAPPWSVIEVSATRNSDGPPQGQVYLVFPTDPRQSHYLGLMWGDRAPKTTEEIRRWAVEHAPGIPPKLADCFAYHVLRGR